MNMAMERERSEKETLFKAARLRTLTPNLSALRIASSMCLLMPSVANGKKYCKSLKKKLKKLNHRDHYSSQIRPYYLDSRALLRSLIWTRSGWDNPSYLDRRKSESKKKKKQKKGKGKRYLKTKARDDPSLVQVASEVIEREQEGLRPCPHD